MESQEKWPIFLADSNLKLSESSEFFALNLVAFSFKFPIWIFFVVPILLLKFLHICALIMYIFSFQIPEHIYDRCLKVSVLCLAGVAQLVGALSCAPKVSWFDS